MSYECIYIFTYINKIVNDNDGGGSGGGDDADDIGLLLTYLLGDKNRAEKSSIQ